MAKKGLAKFKRKNPEGLSGFVSSLVPSVPADFKEFALPIGVSFAAGRIIDRASRAVLATRFPKLAKHAGPLSGVASLIAAYYATEKIQSVRKYQSGALIGLSLSLLISILQTYMPKIAAMLGLGAAVTPTVAAPVPQSDEYGSLEDDAQYDSSIPVQQALPDAPNYPEPGLGPVEDEVPAEGNFGKGMFS